MEEKEELEELEYSGIKELTPRQKWDLLSKNIWRKSECCAYIGYQAPALTKFFKKMEKPPFTACVYRDEFLKFIKTNVKDEQEVMKRYIELDEEKK